MSTTKPVAPSPLLKTEIEWLPFPANKPPSVFLKGEYKTKVPYFVVLAKKQVSHLIWHAHVGQSGKWELMGGKPFHGTVLYFASHPTAP